MPAEVAMGLPARDLCPPHIIAKRNYPCILEDRMSTKPILSEPHLQGPKVQYILSLPLSK